MVAIGVNLVKCKYPKMTSLIQQACIFAMKLNDYSRYMDCGYAME